MEKFIEQRIIEAVKNLLSGRVNEILNNYDLLAPIIEFGNYTKAVFPVITLNSCETTEKERIIRLDAYSLSISFTVAESADSEIFCYAYCHVFNKALNENPTLGGVVDRAVVTSKKYTPPKVAGCGQGWEVVISLRVTVENPHPCGFST